MITTEYFTDKYTSYEKQLESAKRRLQNGRESRVHDHSAKMLVCGDRCVDVLVEDAIEWLNREVDAAH